MSYIIDNECYKKKLIYIIYEEDLLIQISDSSRFSKTLDMSFPWWEFFPGFSYFSLHYCFILLLTMCRNL